MPDNLPIRASKALAAKVWTPTSNLAMPKWTYEEDKMVLAELVSHIDSTKSLGALFKMMSRKVGRKAKSIATRFYMKLGKRFHLHNELDMTTKRRLVHRFNISLSEEQKEFFKEGGNAVQPSEEPTSSSGPVNDAFMNSLNDNIRHFVDAAVKEAVERAIPARDDGPTVDAKAFFEVLKQLASLIKSPGLENVEARIDMKIASLNGERVKEENLHEILNEIMYKFSA